MAMIIVIVLVLLYLLSSIRVVMQNERGVVFTLGKFSGTRAAGITVIFGPFQTMAKVSLRTVTMQIPSQKIITKDNVSIDIAAVAYYKITDPEKAVIAIESTMWLGLLGFTCYLLYVTFEGLSMAIEG